jgi:hypothetical protein
VRNAQNEICRKRLEARVEEALWRLGSLLEAARSNAQENNVEHLQKYVRTVAARRTSNLFT